MAETKSTQSTRLLGQLRGAEGDRLTERSEGRKLPQLEPRALAVLRNLKTFFGGASGGMQGGPRRGRSPITGPTLLRAAQASQTSPEGDAPCPKGRKIETDHPNWEGTLHANTSKRASDRQPHSKKAKLHVAHDPIACQAKKSRVRRAEEYYHPTPF